MLLDAICCCLGRSCVGWIWKEVNDHHETGIVMGLGLGEVEEQAKVGEGVPVS